MTRPLAAALFELALLAGGCSDPASDLGAGAACVRTYQCAPGLACVSGACSTDLGALAEAGMVPPIDASMMMVVDAGADAGPPPADAGPPPADAGPPPRDAGPPPPRDSGPPPPTDSGPPPPTDSGPPPPTDSGPPPPMDSGAPDTGM